jgi:hypothetical protein
MLTNEQLVDLRELVGRELETFTTFVRRCEHGEATRLEMASLPRARSRMETLDQLLKSLNHNAVA